MANLLGVPTTTAPAVPPEEEYIPPEQAPIQQAPVEQAPVEQAPANLLGVPTTTEPAQQAPVQQATPVESVPSPGLGGVPQYTAEPPPQEAPPPPGPPGEWYSGAGDAIGRVATGVTEAAGNLAAGDPKAAGLSILKLAAAPQEWAVPRLEERAARGDALGLEELVEDPSKVWDIVPTATTAPGLIDPLIDPGTIQPPDAIEGAANALGNVLSTDVVDPIAQALGVTTPPSPTEFPIGMAARVSPDPNAPDFDVWMQQHPEAAAQDPMTAYETWKASIGAQSAPPPEWVNPLDDVTGGALERAKGVVGNLDDMGAGVADSLRSGSLGPFARSMLIDLGTDPTLPAQAGLMLGSGVAGAAARTLQAAGHPGLARIPAGLSRGAQLVNQSIDVAGGDVVSPIAAAGAPIARGIKNLGGATSPSAEGLTQIQADEIVSQGTQFLEARAAQPGAAPVPPLAPSPARRLPGTTPVSQGPAANPYAPFAPDQIPAVRAQPRQAPTTGAPVSPVTLDPKLDAALQKQVTDRGLRDIQVRVFDSLQDISPMATPEDAALWRRRQRMIALAADVIDDAPHYIDHEVIHALADEGVFAPREWSSLMGEARAQGLEARIREQYPDVDPMMHEQEMVAALYTQWRANPSSVSAPVRTILQRIADFLKSLGGVAREAVPYETLRNIDNGSIGRRSRQATGRAMTANYTGDAMSRYRAPGYHGSPERNLTTLSADPNFQGRNFENAAVKLGAFFTPDQTVAREFMTPTPWDNQGFTSRAYRAGGGHIYRGELDLQNAYDISADEFAELDSPLSDSGTGATLRQELEAAGHDGVVVWADEAFDETGTPPTIFGGTDEIPQEMIDAGLIQEVASFNDVPVRPTGRIDPDGTDVVYDDAFSRLKALTYHGSNKTDLETLSTEPPERHYDYGSSSLGVFTTPDKRNAFGYIPMGDPRMPDGSVPNTPEERLAWQAAWRDARQQVWGAGTDPVTALGGQSIGRVYMVLSDLQNAHDMSRAEMNPFYNGTPRAMQEAAELKARLQAEGHDGIVVWKDEPTHKPEQEVRPEDLDDIEEVIHFEDQDAFARVYHGSRVPGITTLTHDLDPERLSNDNMASSFFGVFTTPDEMAARQYATNARTGSQRTLYSAEVDLSQPFEMDLSNMSHYYTSAPEIVAEALELRESLLSEGYDGIIVRDTDRGFRAPEESPIIEIVSFDDVPVLSEDAFARRPRNAPQSLGALGFVSGHAREEMLARTDPNASPGYGGLLLSPGTNAAAHEAIDVHWADGARQMRVPFGQVLDETMDELNMLIDYAGNPALQSSDPVTYARLTSKFTIPDHPTDFAAMGGPGNSRHQEQLKEILATGVIKDAYLKAQPKTAKTGMSNALVDAAKEFMRVRTGFQLFNIANIPRYFFQNWAGNLINLAVNAPSSVPFYITRFRDLRETTKIVQGKVSSPLDDALRDAGLGVIPVIKAQDKYQLGRTSAAKAPPEKTLYGKAARVFQNDTATAIAQTSDVAVREVVAQTTLEEGYRILNAKLGHIVKQQVKRANTSFSTLPFSDQHYTKAINAFLDTKRVRINGTTGRPRTTWTGRPAKTTPLYNATEFSQFMKTELQATGLAHDPRQLDQAVQGIWADVELQRQVIRKHIEQEVERVAFRNIPTNASEAARLLFMYPYWTTKQGMLYAQWMLAHPAGAAVYSRMMEDLEERSEVLGMPPWMTTFFRIMDTPMGMSVWSNPLDLATTFLTFPDAMIDAGGTGDLTAIGKARDMLPFQLNALLDFAAYATGMYGPDANVPDLLGANRLSNNVSMLLNAANAHGLLDGIPLGKDAAGNPVPINPKPLQELYSRAGNAISSILQPLTNWEPVPVGNVFGSMNRDIALWVEQGVRTANPNLEQAEVFERATAILADPNSAEYQEAAQRQSMQGLTVSGIDTAAPDWMDTALEAVLRMSSPIAFTQGPEQLFLDSRAPGMTPSGDVPERNIPYLGDPNATEAQAEEATRTLNESKYGASDTVPARQFREVVNDYWDGRDPNGIGDIGTVMWGIYQNVDEPSTNVPEAPVSIGGVEYTPADIGALDRGARNALANAYAAEHGQSIDSIKAFYQDAEETYDVEAFQANPMLGQYIQFTRDAKDYPGGKEQFVVDMMSVNPAYGQYVREDAVKDGRIDTSIALNSDGYLASQGVAPSVYSSLNQLSTTGTGGPAAPGPAPVTAQPSVAPTADLNLRAQPSKDSASIMVLGTGTPLEVIENQGEWMRVTTPGNVSEGWVASAFLKNLNGNGTAAPAASNGHGSIPVLSGVTGAIGSLIDAAGSVVGTMFSGNQQGSKPVANGTGYFDVVPAVDGMGVQSTNASDRTWLENAIGPGHAYTSGEYKSPPPEGVSYAYQNGHGADESTHAAYDVTCDDPMGNCVGTPMFAPIAGKVVCAGYGQGTGEALGSPQCTYSLNTTHPGQAHDVVLAVGQDGLGNPLQISFSHMGTSAVQPGQMVNPGDPMGSMGATDGGPHTHIEGWGFCPTSGVYHIVDAQLIMSGYYADKGVC